MAEVPKKLSHKFGANRKEIARRFRIRHGRFGQAHAETPLEAQEQLDAAEAVETVVLIEPGVERGGDGGARRVQLRGELSEGLDQRIRVDGAAAGSSFLPRNRRFHLSNSMSGKVKRWYHTRDSTPGRRKRCRERSS